MRRSAVLVVVLLLAGCAGANAKFRNTPSYRQGYEDGCAAATDEGADLRERPVGDHERYASDDAYRAGYGSGLSLCRRNDLGSTATQRPGPVVLPGPGN